MDADVDAIVDALPMGTLSPDPPLPIGSPCAGVLGFPNPPSSPGRANWMRTADIDGDGRVDVVKAYAGTDFSIARGLGNGAFVGPRSLTGPGTLQDFALSDVSGDGRIDIIAGAANANDYAVYVALNDGTGQFGAFAQVASAASSNRLIVSDIDGNGRNDIIAMGASSHVVSVIRQTSSGFEPPVHYTVGSTIARDLAVGDLSGDGRPELVVTHDNSINVLLNTGTGTFGTLVAYQTPSGAPHGVAIADMNEDGTNDVIAVTGNSSLDVQLAVLLGTGTGTLETAAAFPLFTSYPPTRLSAGDLDGNGHIDIAIAHEHLQELIYVLGTGTGQVGPVNRLPFATPRQLELADVNNDSRIDLVVTNNVTTAFLNTGGQRPFLSRNRVSLGVTTGFWPAHSARLLDIDGNETLDIVDLISDGASYSIGKAVGVGDGTFVMAPPQIVSTSGHTALSDTDNSSVLDFVIVGRTLSSPAIETFLVSATGDLTSAGVSLMDANDVVSRTLADVDGTGIRDVVRASRGPFPFYTSDVKFYPGNGAGQFGAGVPIWTGAGLQDAAVGDLDGNGFPDLVVHYYDTGPKQDVLLATGLGVFGPPMTIQGTGVEFPSDSSALRDVNNDGRLDLIGANGSNLLVALGRGDGTFDPALRSPAGGRFAYGQFIDVNGDGKVDLAAPGSGSVAMSLGNGDGTFSLPFVYESGGADTSLSVGDVDDDGRLDILVTNERDNVSVLRGRCL
ncbi:MAG: FG-GAP repeat domain-containing protein [Kofleriaceae bacterium]